MKIKDFNKLLKEKGAGYILSKYMSCQLFLTNKQLEKVCELNHHRGGTAFIYKTKKKQM